MTGQPLSAADIEAAFAAGETDLSRCNVGRIIHEHEFGEVLEAKVMDAVHYSAPTIARVFKNLGLPPVSKDAVLRHRRGTCRCPKEA